MKRKVCVIGGGIIGIPTAINIIEKIANVEVTIVSEKFSPDTTGDGAAGWWEPYQTGNTPPHLLKRWGKVTWDHLTSLLHSEIGAEIGVQLVAGYNLFRSPQEDPDWKDDVFGFRHVPTDELQKVFPPDCGFPFGWAFSSIVTECQKYLPWLMERFKQHGGKVEQRRVNTIGELVGKYDVVVNCTGVNAFDLVNDKEVVPIKGQVIRVFSPGHMIMASAFPAQGVIHATPQFLLHG